MPETHRRIIFRDPTPDTEPATAREILTAFASRAFRRPAQPAEVDRLMKLYDLARGQGDNFNEGIRLAVEAVLVSPQFLFRLELDPPAPEGTAASPRGVAAGDPPVRALGDYEMASRLSYFLWSSMPDDELLAAAAAGHLHEPADVAVAGPADAGRPEVAGVCREFCGPVVGTAPARAAHARQASCFPISMHDLADAMREETERFFAAIVAEDRSVLDFLDADFTFVNERLARHYGIADVTGSEFRRVQLSGKAARRTADARRAF